MINKLPPQNLEAEQSVLGSILIDSQVIPYAMEHLQADDFYRTEHQEIYKCMVELFNQNKTIDLITINDHLESKGLSDVIGGITYLSELTNLIFTTASIKEHIKIIEEKSIMRKLLKATSDITMNVYEGSETATELIEIAEKKLFDVVQGKKDNGFTHIGDALPDVFTQLEKLYIDGGQIKGVPTGFFDLDRKTCGLQNSDLILVAGRPAMGKTAFALNIAMHVGVKERVPVAVFSLEMSQSQLITRMLASELMIDNQKMKSGSLEEKDWQRLASALGVISESQIYIDDTASINVTQIKAKCRRLKQEKGLGLIVIDYLQLMQGTRKENRQQEISEISRALKILAKELDVPVIALSQLSRACEQRQDHRPMLSDLRESGAIEQDADIVMFLYRDDYYNPQTDKKNISEIIIAKHRNGSVGTVELRWFGEYTKFTNLA